MNRKSGKQSYSIRNAIKSQLNFDQTYELEKIGPSSLAEILVEIDVPHTFKTKSGKSIEFLSIYAPIYNGLDQNLVCKSNFKYVTDEKEEFASFELGDDEKSDEESPKRLKRQVETFNKTTTKNTQLTNDFDIFSNRTFYINCSMPEVVCSKIRCLVDSVENGKIADFYLRMVFNVSAIKGTYNLQNFKLIG